MRRFIEFMQQVFRIYVRYIYKVCDMFKIYIN